MPIVVPSIPWLRLGVKLALARALTRSSNLFDGTAWAASVPGLRAPDFRPPLAEWTSLACGNRPSPFLPRFFNRQAFGRRLGNHAGNV